MRVTGLGDWGWQARLNGTPLKQQAMEHQDGQVRIQVTANIGASVNLVEDGVRVLNWRWGIHRVGAIDINGKEIDSLVRSGIAMSGYEELLEEFFLWLRREHPDVVVVNSAGDASSYSGRDEYRHARGCDRCCLRARLNHGERSAR